VKQIIRETRIPEFRARARAVLVQMRQNRAAQTAER